MARITKKELIEENIKLKSEIALLKQEILTLQAKVNFYQGIEKEIGNACNNMGKFAVDCIQVLSGQGQK